MRIPMSIGPITEPDWLMSIMGRKGRGSNGQRNRLYRNMGFNGIHGPIGETLLCVTQNMMLAEMKPESTVEEYPNRRRAGMLDLMKRNSHSNDVRTSWTVWAICLLTTLGAASPSLAWDTVSLVYHGRMWSEFIPDSHGKILLGSSNEVQFAGMSNFSTGGSYESPVYALIQYGTFVDQVMTSGFPTNLDQYLYQRGLPVVLELAADTNGNRAVAYSFHAGGEVAIRCATQHGTNAWVLEQVTTPTVFTPWAGTLWIDNAIVDGKSAVAHVFSMDGVLRWSIRESETNWTTELVATNAQGPISIAISPQGIPTLSFVSDDQYRWAYRMGGGWNVETISSGRVACAALAFDGFGAIATAYRPESGSNLLYGVRGTFGGWSTEIVSSPSGPQAGFVDLEFDQNNTPALAYSDGSNAYFAQRVNPTQWLDNVAAASSCSPGGCFYSWQYRGREPDLLYLRDGTPIILHHGYSGSYKVDSQTHYYYTSWARMREVPWDWIYHDDADGSDDRATDLLSGNDVYALNQTEVLDDDDIAIRILTSKDLADVGGQMWVHWWNGSQEHWVWGFPEQDVVLESGAVNGIPSTGSVTVKQWRCTISSGLTEPGANYYAIQVKVGSTLPLGDTVFDEDWLLRDVTGTERAITNNLGQSMSEIAEFTGHDWPVSVYADQDGDRIPDLWEDAHGLSSTNPGDASLDFDDDGVPNDQEYIANTNPTNGQSYLAVEDFTVGFPSLVWFFGSSNRLYTLESSVHVDEPANGLGSPWQADPLYTRVQGLNDMQSAPYSPSGTGQFFRVRVNLP